MDLLTNIGIFMQPFSIKTRSRVCSTVGGSGKENTGILIAQSVSSPLEGFVNLELVETLKKHFPHLKVMARAVGRFEVHELEKAGADFIVRETFYSALHMGEQALKELGLAEKDAERAAHLFKHYDEKNLKALSEHYGNEKLYISRSQENTRTLTELLQSDQDDLPPI